MIKHYFSIKEVVEQLDLSASLIRFWEKEFSINIKKNSSGVRLFSSKDIETLKYIKHLLKEKKYTIKGAKSCLSNKNALGGNNKEIIDKLSDIRNFLKDLLKN